MSPLFKPVFLIEYTCLSKSGKVLQNGKMRVKNKATEFEAKASFENYLIGKHKDFGRLIIISCKDENPFNSDFLKDMINTFKL